MKKKQKELNLADSIPVFSTPISKQEASQLNPLVLAFVGDSVQQLYVRTKLVISTGKKAGELHKLAVKEVKAVAQAEMLDRLLSTFSEEEVLIYKRGRNAHSQTTAKNATVIEYRKASGFEALLGYLYLIGSHERLYEILTQTLEERL